MRSLAPAARRLRRAAWPIGQAGIAAGLAWWLTHGVLAHPQPFFAPIAAAISLGSSVGRRWRNAVLMIFGVTLGIGLAEVVVLFAGTGAVTLAAVVVVAMAAAVLLNPVPMFVNQSAASAILVVALHSGGIAGERLLDALIGGGCALLVSLVVFPPQPLPLLGEAMRASLRSVADALGGAAGALESGTARGADYMLAITQAVHDGLGELTTARTTARDIVRIAPLRRGYRGGVEKADARAAHVGLLANTALTLVRLAAAVLEDSERPPNTLAAGVRQLAESAATLARGAAPDERRRVRELVAGIAEERPPVYGPPALAAAELQLRSAAGDMLRVIRDDEEEAAWARATRVRSAAASQAAAARSVRRAAVRSGGGALRRR